MSTWFSCILSSSPLPRSTSLNLLHVNDCLRSVLSINFATCVPVHLTRKTSLVRGQQPKNTKYCPAILPATDPEMPPSVLAVMQTSEKLKQEQTTRPKRRYTQGGALSQKHRQAFFTAPTTEAPNYSTSHTSVSGSTKRNTSIFAGTAFKQPTWCVSTPPPTATSMSIHPPIHNGHAINTAVYP